ncbi:hypothetical protein ACTXT7_007315 [Hymenolepis weldensis]
MMHQPLEILADLSAQFNEFNLPMECNHITSFGDKGDVLTANNVNLLDLSSGITPPTTNISQSRGTFECAASDRHIFVFDYLNDGNKIYDSGSMSNLFSKKKNRDLQATKVHTDPEVRIGENKKDFPTGRIIL